MEAEDGLGKERKKANEKKMPKREEEAREGAKSGWMQEEVAAGLVDRSGERVVLH